MELSIFIFFISSGHLKNEADLAEKSERAQAGKKAFDSGLPKREKHGVSYQK
jgi:hypothetical protein